MQQITHTTRYETPPFLIEPMAVYKSKRREFLTSHQLADFRKCPFSYRQKMSGLVPEVIYQHMRVGHGTHTLVLEGRGKFDAEYQVGGPINPKTGNCFGEDTKAFREWAEQQTRIVLSDEQYATICHMQAAVYRHSIASRLLGCGSPEGVLRGTYCGVKCQIRVDWFNPCEGIVDLKTCDNLDDFEQDIVNFGYVEQMAFYRTIIGEHAGDVPVHLIGVEKEDPYRCGAWLLSPHKLDIAASENAIKVQEFATCKELDYWPTGYESLRVI